VLTAKLEAYLEVFKDHPNQLIKAIWGYLLKDLLKSFVGFFFITLSELYAPFAIKLMI
jgi:hypothetical protein